MTDLRRISAPNRRAVTIGVERFDAPFERLPFAADLVGELSQALRSLGYETTVRAETELASAGLGEAIREHLDADDADGVLIVHVLTHGGAGDGNATVYLLGSDGKAVRDTDVAHWLTSLHNVGDRPLTLFLLDLCQAGTVARLPWQVSTDRSVRGWVIAACRGDRPAYDGRFTKAVINVLRALTAGDLGIDPALEHVPLDTVARAIRREVNRLTAAEDSYPQQVTATLVDISSEAPNLPFFPNPAYRDDPRLRLRSEVDSGLLPFLDDLDEGLDARHFVERAAGAGPLPDPVEPLTGCFTGRANELRQLSPWLSGEGAGSLHVVTGSPGVGKSALLGVLVCAAHPLLRDHTRPLWDRIAQRPLRLEDLAAVHARRRSLADVTRSISRQLCIPEFDTAANLVFAIARLPRRPVIIVDALDEADKGVELMRELLMPLATAHKSDGTPAARLLIGVRRYEDYSPMLKTARAEGGLVDLDEVPARVLEDNLYQYVTELLRADPFYRLRGAVVGAFAAEVARVLSEQASQHREWGEFLVAGLYTRHLLTIHSESLNDASQAARLGAQAPRTLPEVLELDLSAHRVGPLVREVVTILAHARGQGMPLTVLARLAASSSKTPPSTEDIRRGLQAAQFYVRQSTDIDGSTLYRLFHQGLSDHLRKRPLRHMLAHLLAGLGPNNARNWQAAEPYLLRHTLDHAAETDQATAVLHDPGFLLQRDPEIPLTTLDGQYGDVYRASLDLSVLPPKVNRAALALNAVRAGITDLADRIARVPGEPAPAWCPRWVRGKPDAGPRLVIRIPIVVTGGQDGTVRVWDLATRQQIGDPMTGHQGRVSPSVLGELDGRPIVATGGGRDGTVRVWDLATRQQIGDPMTGHQGRVSAPALGELDGRPIVVTGGQDGTVRVWDLATRRQIGDPMTGHQGWARLSSIGELDGRPIVVTGGQDGTVRVWDLATRQQIGDPMTGHQGRLFAPALGELDGRPIVVTSGQDGTVRVWDLATRQQIGDPMTGHKGLVSAPALGELDGRPIVVTSGQDGTVRVWDLATRQQIGDPMTGHKGLVSAPALGELDGRPIAVTGSQVGLVGIWDLATHQQIRYSITGNHGSAPEAVLGEFIHERSGRMNDSLVRLTPGKSTPAIRSLAVIGRIGVLGNDDGGTAIVDIGRGTLVHEIHDDDGAAVTTVVCKQIAGRPIAIVVNDRRQRRVLNLLSGETINADQIYDPLLDVQQTAPSALIETRGSLLKVCGGRYGTITLVGQDTFLRLLPGRHDGAVTAVACAFLNDRPTAFTGGQDGTVRVWDLLDRQLLDTIDVLGPVFAIHATGSGELLIGAGGEVSAFQYTSTTVQSTRDLV